MLSLSGLLLIPTTEYVGIALSVVFVAISSVVTTLTLLPAVLRLLGHRVNKGRVPGTDPTREPVGWQRTARAVIGRPALATVAACSSCSSAPHRWRRSGWRTPAPSRCPRTS